MATTTWNNRGREAESPSQIPLSGWKDTLIRVKNSIKEDRLSLVASGMAYYFLLAFVPAISAFVLIYAWLSDPATIVSHLNSVSRFLPVDVLDTLKNQLTDLAKNNKATGIGAITSLLISFYSASKGSSAMIEAANIIYNEEDKRSFVKSTLLSLGLTVVATLMSIVAIGVIVGFPAAVNLLHLPDALSSAIGGASWIILLALFSLFLSIVYRYAPCRKEPKWKWVSWGAVIAAVMWAIVSALFSWYAAKFGNFNKTYGSMGAIVVLMLWFYLTNFVILLGGEINAQLEHQTKRDSTEGLPKPMGSRHANMADTIGKSYPGKVRSLR